LAKQYKASFKESGLTSIIEQRLFTLPSSSTSNVLQLAYTFLTKFHADKFLLLLAPSTKTGLFSISFFLILSFLL
jgi:hypothetical protein